MFLLWQKIDFDVCVSYFLPLAALPWHSCKVQFSRACHMLLFAWSVFLTEVTYQNHICCAKQTSGSFCVKTTSHAVTDLIGEMGLKKNWENVALPFLETLGQDCCGKDRIRPLPRPTLWPTSWIDPKAKRWAGTSPRQFWIIWARPTSTDMSPIRSWSASFDHILSSLLLHVSPVLALFLRCVQPSTCFRQNCQGLTVNADTFRRWQIFALCKYYSRPCGTELFQKSIDLFTRTRRFFSPQRGI